MKLLTVEKAVLDLLARIKVLTLMGLLLVPITGLTMQDDVLFNIALGYVLKNEGGYNDIDGDKGGATNFGISYRFLQSLPEHLGDVNGDGVVDREDIKDLTLENVHAIYKEQFWEKYVTSKRWSAATHHKKDDVKIYLLDMYVNHSPRAVNLMLQRAINACKGDVLYEDGLWGKRSQEQLKDVEEFSCLLVALRAERHSYYRELVEKDSVNKKFIKGWRKRALRIK